MTTMTRRAATPARVWVPSTALPAGATVMLFLLAGYTESEGVRGGCTALALTFMVVACCVGPIVCWAWRTRALEDRHEDETADLCYRLGRAEADVAALSQAYQAAFNRQAVGGGWLPPGPTPPPPPALHLVRDVRPV